MIKENVVIEEVHDIIDPNLLKQMDTQSLNSFLKTARACLKKALAERPTMDQVVKELEETLELQSKHQNPGEGSGRNNGHKPYPYPGWDKEAALKESLAQSFLIGNERNHRLLFDLVGYLGTAWCMSGLGFLVENGKNHRLMFGAELSGGFGAA
ncbi:hypothetical protein E3N88_15045 [Mikania micrantha]|uniref:Serine-threonine/tyrosine-protein kinase catalytic domain-containing protein n=1 Tax=Mikania micrantha TaxID=192012 RepID=A0A5N6P680_9ASTR|nr:hypothetical protein E3N88_15045 [Mikania micrantha]